MVAVGCGTAAGPPRSLSYPPSVPVIEQIRAVREGRSTSIDAAEPLTDADWAMLAGCRHVREIILRRGVADDARAEIVAALPQVERLVLRESPLSDQGLAALGRCTSLRDLNLPRANCTAAGIRALGGVATLRSLRIGSPHLSGVAACVAIGELDGLVSLHLIDVPIGDEGLDVLAKMPGLRTLYLDGAGVSDEAWARYVETRPDVHVHVDQAHHDRDPRRDHDSRGHDAPQRSL